jgi:hypothetical protein
LAQSAADAESAFDNFLERQWAVSANHHGKQGTWTERGTRVLRRVHKFFVAGTIAMDRLEE